MAASRGTLTWKQAGGADADESAFLDQIRRLLERTPSLHANRVNIIGLKRVEVISPLVPLPEIAPLKPRSPVPPKLK